jgi:hydrogenase maturation protease
LRGDGGEVVGVVVRRQEALEGSVGLSAGPGADGVFKVRVRVENRTPLGGGTGRDEALLHALVSTHAVLGVRGGEFVSLLDPPERWRELAAGCRNEGAWPVLVGEEGERDTMLASPIILYDYPRVAPESPGDLFDATEIDEILTLRILTLTDEEKRQAAAVDGRARELLRRTEALAREQLLGLHGAVRGLRPVAGEPGAPAAGGREGEPGAPATGGGRP